MLLRVDDPLRESVAGVHEHCRDGDQHYVASGHRIKYRIHDKCREPRVPLLGIAAEKQYAVSHAARR